MSIAVECYPDEVVLRELGIPRRQLLHQARKGEVFNWLKKTPGGIGMVDDDPTSTQPCDRCNYRQIEASEGLLLLARFGSGGQRLIVVCPRLEDWLMQRAQACGIDSRRYQLPSTPKDLHDIPRYEQKDGFRRFLAELRERDNGMSHLRRWVFQGESL
jgi:hypothetical protein